MAVALVPVSSLTQKEAWDYLHDLRHAICNPELEFDTGDEEARQLYEDKINEVKEHLATFDPPL